MTLPMKVQKVQSLFIENGGKGDSYNSKDSLHCEKSIAQATEMSLPKKSTDEISALPEDNNNAACFAIAEKAESNMSRQERNENENLYGHSGNSSLTVIDGPLDSTPKNGVKHKRSKSLTGNFQKLLRREKRLSSTDENKSSRNKVNGAVCGGEAANNVGFLSTPKGSPIQRRHSEDDGEPEVRRKLAYRMNSRLKGFFRTISLNSISDSKRNSSFISNESCQRCKEKEHMLRNVISMETFNTLADERDVLKKERDRAVEEWSLAASRWEKMLDDMDSMMSELVQVRFFFILFCKRTSSGPCTGNFITKIASER